MARKGLKICCGVTAILTIIFVTVFTTLLFTVFKPKEPKIIAHPIGLENIQFGGSTNVTVNITLGMVITIDNNNYGSFKFGNSTANVYYHGVVVGEVPIQKDFVPAHTKINITTSVDLMADKLIESLYFVGDLIAGSLNLTSTAWLHGNVKVLRVLKLHAKTFSSCEISVFIRSQDIESSCNTELHL